MAAEFQCEAPVAFERRVSMVERKSRADATRVPEEVSSVVGSGALKSLHFYRHELV